MHTLALILLSLLSVAVVTGTQFKFYGLDYTARRINYCPSQAQVNQDMQIVASLAEHVRIYSLVDCNQGPMIFEAIISLNLPLRVALGMWLDIYYYAEFPNEYQALVNLNQQYGLSLVDSVIVGSETQYRGDFSAQLLISFISNVSTTVKQQMNYPNIQVTTADVIGSLEGEPQIIAAVDFVAYNEFAFWENVDIQDSISRTISRYNEILGYAQGKQVVISEVGWPNAGPVEGAAVPSNDNENYFFQNIVCWATQSNIPMFYFAAFDSLWQADDDQKYWGLYNESRMLKSGISLDFPCSPVTQGSSSTSGSSQTQAPTTASPTTKAPTTPSPTTPSPTTKAPTKRPTASTTGPRSSSSTSSSTKKASTMSKASSTTAKVATAKSTASSTTGQTSFTTLSTSTTGSANTCAACGSQSCCYTSPGSPACYDSSSYSCIPSGGSSNVLCGVSYHNNVKYYDGYCGSGCYDSYCYSCSNNALAPTGKC